MGTFAKYRSRSIFYFAKRPSNTVLPMSPKGLRKPKLSPEATNALYAKDRIDLRSREALNTVEEMRHPRERDFYQDHTYHETYIDRELDKSQRAQLTSRYPYFAPNFVADPWVWYVGDIVEVVRGKHTGQRGAIVAVIKYKNEIMVQNVNVRDVTIPATDSRPEQIVQREHPISIDDVAHVDPIDGKTCELTLVKIRAKEGGEREVRRVSLSSGAFLPIPKDSTIDTGDPVKDTPYHDALEPTYDAEKELDVLVQEKLHAMEDYFVAELKSSYEFHEPLMRANAEDMQKFQRGVVDRAIELVARRIKGIVSEEGSDTAPATAWWYEDVAPHIEALQSAEERERVRSAIEKRIINQETSNVASVDDGGNDDEPDDDEDDSDEEQEENEKMEEKPDEIGS